MLFQSPPKTTTDRVNLVFREKNFPKKNKKGGAALKVVSSR